jgi:hypothetical protein
LVRIADLDPDTEVKLFKERTVSTESRVKKLKLPPYAARSDLQKIRSQWSKLTGLHGRDEPSAAIVRAATAVELSINLAIRAEFTAQSKLSTTTVDAMMRKANGLRNKMQYLLMPLVIDRPNEAAIKKLWKVSEKINDDRNNIVHSGYFSNRPTATAAIERCRTFINSMVGLYEEDFELGPLVQNAIEDLTPEVKPAWRRKAKVKKTKGRIAHSDRSH